MDDSDKFEITAEWLEERKLAKTKNWEKETKESMKMQQKMFAKL